MYVILYYDNSEICKSEVFILVKFMKMVKYNVYNSEIFIYAKIYENGEIYNSEGFISAKVYENGEIYNSKFFIDAKIYENTEKYCSKLVIYTKIL